jgi:tetratricopeptide (TPR) repeat protein
MSRPFSKSPSYQSELSALLRMHQLSLAGKEESEEADSVRESAYDYWDDLSKLEKDRLTGLSKDLYEISDGPAQAPELMNPQAQGKLVGAYEARERGDWDKALELLRRWGKYIPAALVSYLRGTIWRSAGEPAVAKVFFEHVSHLEPENENYQAVLLHTLKVADPVAAATRAEAVLQASETKSPAVVVYAADIIFGQTSNLSDIDSLPVYKRLIPILERTLIRMEGREDVDVPALAGMVLCLLATSYENIDDTRKAYVYYSRAIQLDPTNDALLVARGILMYGTDPNATTDLEQAIRLGSPLVYPYFYLAHHYLGSNRFEDCRAMCEWALHKQATPRVQSELCEFLGISLTVLGYPEQVIRRELENAIRLDPSNERARRNMEWFETALTTPTTHKEWERISDSSMRKFGQQEARSDPAFYENRKLVSV